jgi:hypothetical protein
MPGNVLHQTAFADHIVEEPALPRDAGAEANGAWRSLETARRKWSKWSAREQQLAASLSKRGKRTRASGLGVGNECRERRHVAKGIKLRRPSERRRCEVSPRDSLLQVLEAALVVAGVAEEPSLLKDGFGIVDILSGVIDEEQVRGVASGGPDVKSKPWTA